MLKFFCRLSCTALLLALPLASQAAPYAYNAFRTAGCIDIIDTGTGTSSECAINPGGTISAVELVPGGTDLYVAQAGSSALKHYRYNGSGGSATVAAADITLPGIPTVMLASADSQTLWVGLDASNVLQRVQTADGTITTLDLGFVPGVLATNTAGTTLYVAEKDGARLLIIDLTQTTLTVPTPITLAGPATAMVLNSADSTLYVAHAASNSISVRNASTGTQSSTLSVSGVQSLMVNGSRLFAGTPDSIRIWNTSSLVEATPVAISGTPRCLAASESLSTETVVDLYALTSTGQWISTSTTADTVIVPPQPGRFVGPYRSVVALSTAQIVDNEAVGTTQKVIVRRLGDATRPLVVHFETYDLGTPNSYAHAGSDYVALSQDFVLEAGVFQVQPAVQLINDEYYGETENFGLRVSLPEATDFARLGTITTAIFGIENDDKDPRDRGGCSLGNGRPDPLLPLLLGTAAVVLWRRRRSAH